MERKSGIDTTFWGLYIILLVIAVIALFSASSTLVYKSTSLFTTVGQQIVFLALGVLVAYMVQFMPSVWIRRLSYVLFAFSVFMCLCTMFPSLGFVETKNEAARWVRIWKISFQPSELAKLSLVIVVADLLSRAKTDEEKKKYFYWTAGLAAITVVPIMLGNLSTAVLIWGIFVLLLFLARIPWKYISMCIVVPLVLLAIILAVAKFVFMDNKRPMPRPLDRAETWVNRVDAFVDKVKGPSEVELQELARLTPEQKITREKAQIKQDMGDRDLQRTFSLLAIWRGGKSPLGVLPGNSRERDFLPYAYADYIFAIIVEESGVIGAGFLMFIFLAILFRACYVSSRYDDYAAMLMMMGLALMLTCQALISMAVVAGLGPVTGQPLPLITRGGTSAVVTSLYFGIMMCVSREQALLRNRVRGTEKASESDVPELVILEQEKKEPEEKVEPVALEIEELPVEA